MIIKLAGVYSSILRGGDKKWPSRKFFGMTRTALKTPFKAGSTGFNAGTTSRTVKGAEDAVYSDMGSKMFKEKPEVKEYVTGTSKSFPSKLNLGQALTHDIKHGQRNLSRKFNNLLGIPSVTGRDNRLVRHMKNNSAGYTLGAGTLGSAVLAGSRQKKMIPIDDPLVKSANIGPYASLVNQAISSSKLSPATKLMGTSAENAVKVMSATPVKSFTSIAKNTVKAFR
jgi:hypothetical protein